MVGRGLVWQNEQWNEVFKVDTDPFTVTVDGEVLTGEKLDAWVADQHKPVGRDGQVDLAENPEEWLKAEASLVRTYFRVVID